MQHTLFLRNRHTNILLTLFLLALMLGLLRTQAQAITAATDCTVQTDIPQAECETLVALYNNTDGSNWTNNTGWNVINTPCSWYGITCNSGSVQKIFLDNNQLNGSIPNLDSLTNLQGLWLYSNQLSGSIPDLSALTNLTQLGLDDNQLSGPIPDLSTLTKLQDIGLSHNQLTGSLPNLSALPHLVDVYLNNNHLTGPIPDLYELAWLNVLKLENNELTGSIPDVFSLKGTFYVFLNNNQLSGIVPASICQVGSIDIGYNKFQVDTAASCVNSKDPDWKATQTVPPNNIVGTALSTTQIGLTWDAIRYTQDGGYYGVWGKVQGDPTYTLMMTTTNKTITNATVTGLQPATTYEFVVRTFTPAHGDQQNDLTSVDSEAVTATTNIPIGCSFQTEIPEAECETLIAFFNSTGGPNWAYKPGWNVTNAPCSWYGVTCSEGRVQKLQLIDNRLIGSIPNLSALTSLQEIKLTNRVYPWTTQLSGPIPDLSALINLQSLDLSYTQLNGSISDLSTPTNLQEINLSHNQLSGSIPDFSTSTNLQDINLNNNQFSGTIPDLSSLTNLLNLDLHSNQLSGSIPDLSALTSLRGLNLNNNQLSGSIPDLSALTSLQWLGLGWNQLSGTIPDLSALTSLQWLRSDNNQLSGNVPASVCQASLYLDLDYNKLEVETADSCIDAVDPNWKETQTVPPTNVAVSSLTNANIHLTWDAIAYTQDGGYYGVWGKPQGDPTYSLLATTADKTITGTIMTDLQPDTNYEFVLRTFTPAHGDQQNDLMSVDSDVTIALTSSHETYTLFLPIITKPPQFDTAALNNTAIPIRPVTAKGEVFHTTTVNVDSDLPSGGKFYLSSSASLPVAAAVDDEIGILLNGVEVFTYTYGQAKGVYPALVEVPRSVMTQIAGKSATVIFRDVYGDKVFATELYLIWSP